MPDPKTTDIPIAFLRECFVLDAKSGLLIWKRRPREHFTQRRIWKMWNARYAGEIAGARNENGYVFIRFVYAGRPRVTGAHRIVFTLAYGHYPEHEVDHIYGVVNGDGIDNLREATHHQNQHNRTRTNRNNTSGFPGVTWNKERRKWVAQITVNSRNHRLGRFNTPEAAHAAYLAAKAKRHPL